MVTASTSAGSAGVAGGGDQPLASRRHVLQLAMVASISALSAACSGDGHAPAAAGVVGPHRGSSDTTSVADPDVALVTSALGDEEQLGRFYASVRRHHQGEPGLVAGLVARQRLHVARLRSSLSGPLPRVTTVKPVVPEGRRATTDALANAAGTARDARLTDCLASHSGALAALFASLAGAHAVSVWLTDPQSPPLRVLEPESITGSDARALQSALRAEHAAVFGYGVVGGVVSAGVATTPLARAAISSYDAHRARRDVLTSLISASGVDPDAALPVYDLPFPVHDAGSARHLSRVLEERCASAYNTTVTATTTEARLFASRVVADCAVRGVQWGAPPPAFPGLAAT